jgi:hypothetical protein
VAALLAGGLLVFQHQELGNLKQENRELQSLNVRPSPQVQASISPDDLERLKSEAAEVHRLRSRLTLLEQDLTQAKQSQDELERLKQWLREQAEQPPLFPEEELAEEDPIRNMGMRKLNMAKSLALAFILRADENHGLFPANWEEAAPHFAKAFDGTAWDPADPVWHPHELISLHRDWEIVYSGLSNELVQPQETILVRETNPWYDAERGIWLRTYGFADGHSEIVSRADGDFAAWEEERSLRAFHLPHQSPPH